MASGQSTLPSCYFRSHCSFLVKGEMQSSFDDNLAHMCEKERRKAMVGVVQPHKINVVNVAPFQCVGFNQVRKMNRHVHFFLTIV